MIRLVVAGPDAQQSFAGDKVREYLSEAVRSERGGRAAEAVSLLEQALAINPPNRRDIHVRLCRLALGPLANLALARRHLEAILSEDPAAGEAKELAEKIAAREKELAAPKAKAAKVVVKTPATGLSGRRKLWGLGGALLLVATLGVNVWIWLVPRGERPKTVRVEMVAAILPTESARLFRNRLYITVAPEWHELAEVEQKARLARVFEWARKTYAAQEVLASDRKPVLVGKVARGQVVVYRGKR